MRITERRARRCLLACAVVCAFFAASPAWAQKAKKSKPKPPSGSAQPSSGASFGDLADDLQEAEPGSVPPPPAAPAVEPPTSAPAPATPPPAYDDLPPLPATSSPPALRPPPGPAPTYRDALPARPPEALDTKAAGPTRVLVMDLSAEGGVFGPVAASMTLLVADAVRALKSFKVMGLKDLYGLPQTARAQGCMGSSCLIDASGAEYLVEGSVGVRDGQNVLYLKLIDRKIPVQVSSAARSLPVDPAGRSNSATAAVRELFETLVSAGVASMPIPLPAPDPAPAPAPISAPAVSAAAPAPAAHHPYRLWWILSLAGGAALVTGGVVTHSLAVTEASYFGRGDYLTADEQDSASGRFSTYRALTITQYTVGGAMLVAGAVLLGLDLTTPPAAGAVGVSPEPDRLVLTWSWQ